MAKILNFAVSAAFWGGWGGLTAANTKNSGSPNKNRDSKKKSANSIKNCGLYTIYKIVSIVHTDTHVLLAGNNFFAASYVFFLCDIL